MGLTQKDIRALVHQAPFQPFRLYLANGKEMHVPHPDFVLVSAEYVVVAAELPGGVPGGIKLVPYEQIVRVEMLHAKRKAAKTDQRRNQARRKILRMVDGGSFGGKVGRLPSREERNARR